MLDPLLRQKAQVWYVLDDTVPSIATILQLLKRANRGVAHVKRVGKVKI